MLKNFVKLFPLRGLRSNAPTKKTVAELGDLVAQFQALSGDELRTKTGASQR
jgi:hypothetical protein